MMPVSYAIQTPRSPAPTEPDRGKLLDVETHDLVLRGGGTARARGLEAIRQGIKTRILFFRGENFIDFREGVPWIGVILQKGASLGIIRSIIRETIENTPQVLDVPVLNLELSGRSLTIDYEARTEMGPVVSSDYEPLIIEF